MIEWMHFFCFNQCYIKVILDLLREMSEGSLKYNPKISLTSDELELYELSQLAGIVWDPKVFK